MEGGSDRACKVCSHGWVVELLSLTVTVAEGIGLLAAAPLWSSALERVGLRSRSMVDEEEGRGAAGHG